MVLLIGWGGGADYSTIFISLLKMLLTSLKHSEYCAKRLSLQCSLTSKIITTDVIIYRQFSYRLCSSSGVNPEALFQGGVLE